MFCMFVVLFLVGLLVCRFLAGVFCCCCLFVFCFFWGGCFVFVFKAMGWSELWHVTLKVCGSRSHGAMGRRIDPS